jgi:hypothetical protein
MWFKTSDTVFGLTGGWTPREKSFADSCADVIESLPTVATTPFWGALLHPELIAIPATREAKMTLFREFSVSEWKIL